MFPVFCVTLLPLLGLSHHIPGPFHLPAFLSTGQDVVHPSPLQNHIRAASLCWLAGWWAEQIIATFPKWKAYQRFWVARSWLGYKKSSLNTYSHCREVKLILGILVEETVDTQKTLQRAGLWDNLMSPNLFGNVDETHSMKSPEVVYPRDVPGTQGWNA